MKLDWDRVFRIAEKVLGIPQLGLLEELKRAKEEYGEEMLRKRVDHFAATTSFAMKHNLVNTLLGRYYPLDELAEYGLARYEFSVEGRHHLTTLVTKNDWVGLAIPLDGTLDKYQLVSRPCSPEVDPTNLVDTLIMLEARGLRVWNADIYRLIDVELKSGGLKADFCLDKYFRYRFSNGSMQDEIINALGDNDNSIARVLSCREDSLPIRHRLMQTAADVAACGSRICAGGVNVLTAMARPAPYNDYAILLQRRSANVGSRQHTLSTIPGGHHQPMIDSEKELPLSHTVHRELFEELFGGDEVQRDTKRFVHDWYKAVCPSVSWLDQHKEAYDLLLTGLGFSLLTGSYTFSALLAIHDTSYWSAFYQDLQTNWETESRQGKIISSKGGDVLEAFNDPSWTDYGVCTFVEGVRRLAIIDSERVKIPDIS